VLVHSVMYIITKVYFFKASCLFPSQLAPVSPTVGYHMVKTQSHISPGLDSVPGRDGQTDRRTDGRTDRIPIANTRSQQYLLVQLSHVMRANHDF